MKKILRATLLATGLLMSTTAFSSSGFASFEKPKIHEDVDYWADVRYRYEYVDQDGIANGADASTFRVRLGASYSPIDKLSFLAELEANTPLGGEDYNSTTNGKTTYPVVADPDSTELNRAQVTFTGIPNTAVTFGRQRIILDNARFIGNVGWRQNEQTFDSLLVTNNSINDFTLKAGYIWNVHRIFGSQSDNRKFDANNTWIFNGRYTGFEHVTLVGYGYLLDIDENSALSSQTLGFRATGKHPINDGYNLVYTAEYAHQTDRANNTNNLSANYWRGELGMSYKRFSVVAGYESLEGNGTAGSAFQTPLATLHGQNGWADKFLTTPDNGLDDITLKVTYKYDAPENDIMGDVKFVAVYHDFSAENNGTDYGTEWDFAVGAKFFDTLDVKVKYADYNKDSLYTDTEKFWFQVGMKF